MKYKFSKKASSMASLLDIILLVLFTQNIVSSQLVEVKLNKENEIKIASYTAEIQTLTNQIASDTYKLNSLENKIASYSSNINELNDSVESKKNTIEKLEQLIIDKENKEKEKDAEIASISKELQETKEEICSMTIKIKDYNNHMKTVTDYVNKYRKENNLEEYNIFEITSMAKAFEEMSTIVTVVNVRLTKKNIEITYEKRNEKKEIKEIKEFIEWPQELNEKIDNFTYESKEEVGSNIRKKIKELVGQTKLRLLLIWSYDELASEGADSHQINFFDQLMRNNSYIKDDEIIKEFYHGSLGHIEKR